MIVNLWNMSLSPGNEQSLYWGRDGVTTPGTRNYMGVDSPAADAMVAENAGDARPRRTSSPRCRRSTGC